MALNRFIARMLHDVSGTDPAVYLAVVIVAMAIAALASAVPARRAARVDPVEALQSE